MSLPRICLWPKQKISGDPEEECVTSATYDLLWPIKDIDNIGVDEDENQSGLVVIENPDE